MPAASSMKRRYHSGTRSCLPLIRSGQPRQVSRRCRFPEAAATRPRFRRYSRYRRSPHHSIPRLHRCSKPWSRRSRRPLSYSCRLTRLLPLKVRAGQAVDVRVQPIRERRSGVQRDFRLDHSARASGTDCQRRKSVNVGHVGSVRVAHGVAIRDCKHQFLHAVPAHERGRCSYSGVDAVRSAYRGRVRALHGSVELRSDAHPLVWKCVGGAVERDGTGDRRVIGGCERRKRGAADVRRHDG